MSGGGSLFSTIVVQGGVGATLTNTGSILSASGVALQLSGLSDIVINSGFIQGDVAIGSGGWLDTRQGTITGKITAAGGDSTIYGSGLGDTIQTGSGNDVIDGFAGADMMTGGAGDDTYYVDNAGDYIDETGGGDDTVFSFISYDLSDGGAYSGAIERLYLAGSDDLDATGSNKAEKIYGNVGSNLIEGGSGSDTIQGRAGHDVIFGENGNDKILGGSGADVLYGGDGNDGLNGMLGTDTMFGGDGDDIYTVDHIGDVVNEQVAGSSGIDKVISSISFNLADTSQAKGQIEDLTLTGGGAINGTGNNLDNEIRGSSGDNIIDGGRGNDKLTGAGGADGFAFTTNLNANSNVDRIKDFVHNTDKILLENSIFTALGAPGALAAGRFAINSPGDANDFIIYDTTTGGLFYDADGNGAGAAVQFARLLGVPGVTQADFEII